MIPIVTRFWPRPAGWLSAATLLAIVAVNAAGVWEIAAARRGALQESRRIFTLETAGRARALESLLAGTRADLAFLASSPAFFRLEEELASPDPRAARWRRLSAEGAGLLFLRGHPEIRSLMVRGEAGVPLVAMGRRGGVPVLWVPSAETGRSPRPDPNTETAPGPGAAGLPDSAGSAGSPVVATLEVTAGLPPGARPARIEAQLDTLALLHRAGAASGPAAGAAPGFPLEICALENAAGIRLAGDARDAAGPDGGEQADAAEASLDADGWGAASPWRLSCVRRGEPAAALLDPLASRLRLTIALNIAVMGLAALLGWFVIQQTRRRQILEAEAQQEARFRQLERQLFHAERLGTVGRLAAGIAHEINNPLEGISNYLRLAEDDLRRSDPEAAARRLSSVRQGLERAAGIVRQVLAHADPAATPREVVDLHAPLRQAVEFVRGRGEFASVAWSVELAAGPARVEGSPVMLGQVFLNLLVNACEAQPGGGEVSVQSRRRPGDSGRAAIVVEIADRGPGVPAGDQRRVFEPFYSTKQSTGLGLSVCHSIVHQHGGELTVEDRPGGGATFLVRLPEAPAGVAAFTDGPAAARATGR